MTEAIECPVCEGAGSVCAPCTTFGPDCGCRARIRCARCDGEGELVGEFCDDCTAMATPPTHDLRSVATADGSRLCRPCAERAADKGYEVEWDV